MSPWSVTELATSRKKLIAPPIVTLFGFILWTAAFVASFEYLYQLNASRTWVEKTFISETSKEQRNLQANQTSHLLEGTN